MSDVLDAIAGGLVVSVQAAPGTPLAAPEHMAAIARAAAEGGAVAIRAEGADDVRAIKAAVDLPVIGLRKRDLPTTPVRITPSVDDARELAAAGAELIAVDATRRPRPGAADGAELVAAIARELGPVVLADVDAVAAGVAARQAGAVAVATTLAGYTDEPSPADAPDLALVGRLAAAVDCPVIAEGRYGTPDEVHAAFAAGAHAVVVGTAITDPLALTRRFAAAAMVRR
ncbi:MAG TPA: putative N-acetylmannosamine-6-phosphate 2-epimerase [Capillimicrobium sp.]|nr:putative N-acetylmannosamine-6-phosphate 2-epimerase [Capillimicrobium sp.]